MDRTVLIGILHRNRVNDGVDDGTPEAVPEVQFQIELWCIFSAIDVQKKIRERYG